MLMSGQHTASVGNISSNSSIEKPLTNMYIHAHVFRRFPFFYYIIDDQTIVLKQPQSDLAKENRPDSQPSCWVYGSSAPARDTSKLS